MTEERDTHHSPVADWAKEGRMFQGALRLAFPPVFRTIKEF